MLLFKSPFMLDELQQLDYALEGVLFQQLVRMPYSHYATDNSRKEQFFALEDFLRTIADGLWRTFWQKPGPLPFSTSCLCHPGSRFCSIETAISNGRLGGLVGVAVSAKLGSNLQTQWDHVLELALFKSDITSRTNAGISTRTVCEAIFYGFHILLSRTLSRLDAVITSSVHLLVLDSKFGGIIKFGGNLTRLEIDPCNPYSSVAEWIKNHAEINVSPIERIWNKLGNPNWGDLGTLQLLLATFNSIVQWKGPPKKLIASLAADHSLRLQKRWMQYGDHSNQGEILESGCNDNHSFKKQDSRLKLNPGEVILLEDSQERKGFQIKEILHVTNCLSYSVVSLDHPLGLLTMYVGVHPSRLEPSWEGMSQWYNVQRQTKVLNLMKQNGISSKYLPELIASGQILHPGLCSKPNVGDRCDHPWCGTPVLVIFPAGETLSSIIARAGPLSAEEALRCCRDVLTAFRSAALTNIQHSEISPENVVRVDSPRTEPCYVLLSWGRALIEDCDSPAIHIHFSSLYALQYRKLCPSSDVESLIYLLYFVSGGSMQHLDSIESALKWRERNWAKRKFQHHLGEVSALLKAFADYVDNLCRTPYPVDYDIWLRRLNRAVHGFDRGKSVERVEVSLRPEDVAESSGTSGGGPSFSY